MEEGELYGRGWKQPAQIKVIEVGGRKQVLLNGWPYMRWSLEDEATQRIAIAQIYEMGIGTQEEIAKAFGVHIKSVYNYIQAFAAEGGRGFLSNKKGPKGSWKLGPGVRNKILVVVLKEGIYEYKAIQKRLEQWDEHVSLPSIRQVLLENGFINNRLSISDEVIQQGWLFDKEEEGQLYFNFSYDTEVTEKVSVREVETLEDREVNFYTQTGTWARRNYSPAQRIYLDQLEQGEYSAYAGGFLFVPLLEQHSFLPTLKRVIDIPTYEGYSLEELCLTLFYFDVFGFRSIEDFKRVYQEEFGVLIGRTYSPSLFTLRRFLHKVRGLEVSEKLIDEFAIIYLKSQLARWGVMYIDGHFVPYYGMYPISMGWHGVRQIPMKGSYNFIAVDEEFTPWIFLIRSSSEDLLQKIPELIEMAGKIGKEAGLSEEEQENLIVIFDREGYSAELYRYLDGKDKEDRHRRIIFISWAKYAEKWVYDIPERQFNKTVTVTYKIQHSEEIAYFETERVMNKYGKIRTIVIQSGKDKKRAAIYTNGSDKEIRVEKIVQLICRRWGQENLIKELLIKHLINYSPGYVTEEIEEQPMVDNPKVKELKKERANLFSNLHKLKIQLADNILKGGQDSTNWEEIKKNQILLLADITRIDNEILFMTQEINKLPAKIQFDKAHDGERLLKLNYEKKQFFDCIKVFTYNMKGKMCQLLLNHYDVKKEILPALSMIVGRAGHVKLECGELKVQLRRFRNCEIDYAARHLCEDLNRMRPVTLDRFQFPIRYEVL